MANNQALSKHGGRRKGAGRRSLFPKNVRKNPPTSFVVSKDAKAIVAEVSKRTKTSRSDVVDALIRTHGKAFDPKPFRKPREHHQE